jgi:putative flippase GtrA
MPVSAPSVRERAREYVATPQFSKLWRYATVSVISTVLTEVLIVLFYRVLKVGTAAESNAYASTISTLPSYYLNRTWAWGKTGKSHVMREVVPFWVIAAVSVVLSTIAVRLADEQARAHLHSHALETLVVVGANLATYAVIWVAKFVFFNKYLFLKEPDTIEPAAG